MVVKKKKRKKQCLTILDTDKVKFAFSETGYGYVGIIKTVPLTLTGYF